MRVLKQMWKDFREFWKSQVFWALLVAVSLFLLQWRRGLFSAGKVRENLLDILVPYGVIAGLFLIGNVGRTLFVMERDALRKRRRSQKKEEFRAERQAERERDKPPVHPPNLQFRRVFQNSVWVGHEISGHAYPAILLEIGNELSDERSVGNADEIRAHLTLWFAKTPAEAQNGAVLDGVSLNTIIDPIPQEDSGGHEPECVEGTYIYKGPAESRSGLGRSIVTMVQPTESHL